MNFKKAIIVLIHAFVCIYISGNLYNRFDLKIPPVTGPDTGLEIFIRRVCRGAEYSI